MKIRFGLETADSSAVSNLSKPTIPCKNILPTNLLYL